MTVRERLVTSEQEASTATAELGFPVIPKAVGDAITHKAGHCLIMLGIDSGDVPARAWSELNCRVDEAHLRPSGLPVQEFVAGGVEVVRRHYT